jgi:predicted nucleotidyltransferase
LKDTLSIIGIRCAQFDEIKAQTEVIIKKFDPEKIILFGSYAYGSPTSESDVDLLVIVETNDSTLKLSAEIALSLDHSFPLDIIVKTPEQFEKRLQNGDFFLEDISLNGKIMYERADKGMGSES